MNIRHFTPSWWPKSRSRGHNHAPKPWPTHLLEAIRFVLAGVVIALLTYFSPYQRPYNIPNLRLGNVAQESVKAPFLFHVPKSITELARERQAVESDIPTVLVHSPTIGQNQLARLDSVFKAMVPSIRVQMADSLKQRHLQRALPHVIGSLSVDALSTLIRVLSTASEPYVSDFQAVCRQILANFYTTGIIDSKALILAGPTPYVRIGQRTLDIALLYSEDELKQGSMMNYIAPYRTIAERDAVEAVHELLSLFVVPDIRSDTDETRRLRSEARSGVASIKRLYAADDTIIKKNATITQEHIEALDALAASVAEREIENPVKRMLQIAASATIAAFLVCVFGYYLATREKDIFDRPSQLLLLAIVTIATSAIAAYIKSHELDVFLVPTPLAAMLVTILLSPQAGLMLSFVLSLFVGSLFADYYIALTCALTAAVAVYTVRHVRHRNQF